MQKEKGISLIDSGWSPVPILGWMMFGILLIVFYVLVQVPLQLRCWLKGHVWPVAADDEFFWGVPECRCCGTEQSRD